MQEAVCRIPNLFDFRVSSGTATHIYKFATEMFLEDIKQIYLNNNGKYIYTMGKQLQKHNTQYIFAIKRE